MTTAEGKLSGAAFRHLAAEPYLNGTASGAFKLEGRGDGFQDAAASLDGRVALSSQNAALLAIVAEAAALDIRETRLLLNELKATRPTRPAGAL